MGEKEDWTSNRRDDIKYDRRRIETLEEEYNREDLKMREIWGKLKEEEKLKK